MNKPLVSVKSRSQSEPLVSVILPTFNRPRTLARAVQSVFDQTYKNFEVIIVNDGGCDIRPVVSMLNDAKKVRVIDHKENRGLAAARNTALRAAEGAYIAYLDDDDLFYSDHLATLVNSLHLTDYKVAYTDAVRSYDLVLDNGEPTIKKETIQSEEFDREWLLVTNVAPVICFMHTRTALANAGLFDEELGPLEDWDLWIRVSREYEFLHVRKATCEIRWSFDGSTMTSSQMADFIHQRKRIFKKHECYVRQSPRAQLGQSKSLQRMNRDLPQKEYMQDLIRRSKASGTADTPVVRELIARLYELTDRLDKQSETLNDLSSKFDELIRFRERVRQNPGFKAYHWLRNRSQL